MQKHIDPIIVVSLLKSVTTIAKLIQALHSEDSGLDQILKPIIEDLETHLRDMMLDPFNP